jgi:prefoldin subunit 5
LLEKKNAGAQSAMIRYSLTENVYGQAEIDYTDGAVNLWLGANVMIEFSYDEAIVFLDTKLQGAANDMADTIADLAFVRDQIVTSEVNMSRIYNWDVKRKRDNDK